MSYWSHGQYLNKLILSCCLDFGLSFVKLCDPSEWYTMLTWSRLHTLHPYMLYSYTESKQKHVSHTYAMLLHWELAQTFLSTSPQTCLSTFPQNKDFMYLGSLSILRTSLKKETWAICYKKERARKDDKEREMSEKKCRAKKRGWASKIAHDLNHLDLERAFWGVELPLISTHLHSWSCLYVVFL